ncbi:unnamed protein product [Albugo candida]|uniref:J domain-containing protein n=1 Tax=Albugo candida TaxID=65357 RepID=A0A024GJ02_9STRA|nr:unnamed protein product [Albugo candida]|eukprot:CCI46869.1 unnamed protein product [Albugo candida]
MLQPKSDLYGILGLEVGSSELQISRAYKKKSLLHHPDRGGDGKIFLFRYYRSNQARFAHSTLINTVKKFLELKNARDTLMDPKKKKSYDENAMKEVNARRKQREREREMDDKRRTMREELLRKERAFEVTHKSVRKKNEINALRERGISRQMELERKKKEQQEAYSTEKILRDAIAETSISKANRTITIKWEKRAYSHSDETLSLILRDYGEIESIRVRSSSAKVLFREASAASKAVRIEGHRDCWRSVSLQGHLVTDEDPSQPDNDPYTDQNAFEKNPGDIQILPLNPVSLEEHLAFEKKVLGKLHVFARNVDHLSENTTTSK